MADPDEDNEVKLVSLELNHIWLIAFIFPTLNRLVKGQLILKANCQAVNSSKKRTNEFIFTSIFVHFLEESSARKKRFEIIWPLEVDN